MLKDFAIAQSPFFIANRALMMWVAAIFGLFFLTLL